MKQKMSQMIQVTVQNLFYFKISRNMAKKVFLWTKENKIGRGYLTLIHYKNFKTKNIRIDQKYNQP